MEQMITVVAGQPRSGTSLMMQMLHVGGMEVYADDRKRLGSDRRYWSYETHRMMHLPEVVVMVI